MGVTLRQPRICGRDVVAQSVLEAEGRGCGPQTDHVFKADHLGEETLNHLSWYFRAIQNFPLVDPVKQPIPVTPTCHAWGQHKKGQALTQDASGNDFMKALQGEAPVSPFMVLKEMGTLYQI